MDEADKNIKLHFLTPVVLNVFNCYSTKNVNMWVGATWVYLLTLLVLNLAMLMFTLTCTDDLYMSHWEIQHSCMNWCVWLLLDITCDLVTDPAYMHKEFYCLLIQYIARRLSHCTWTYSYTSQSITLCCGTEFTMKPCVEWLWLQFDS